MKYTWKDVIISADDPRAEEAIGKEVYAFDRAKFVSNIDDLCVSHKLEGLDYESIYPFNTDGSAYAFIVVKKEPVMERVPFDFSLKEDRDALIGRKIELHDESEFMVTSIYHDRYKDECWREQFTDCSGAELLIDGWVFADGEDAGQPVGKLVEIEE